MCLATDSFFGQYGEALDRVRLVWDSVGHLPRFCLVLFELGIASQMYTLQANCHYIKC